MRTSWAPISPATKDTVLSIKSLLSADYLTVAEVLATHADLIEAAAALWESLAQKHAFFAGNKRTAFADAYTFLTINSTPLAADAQGTYDFVAAFYETNQFSFEKLVPWLRSHVKQDVPNRF